jgi:hypothetical protein
MTLHFTTFTAGKVKPGPLFQVVNYAGKTWAQMTPRRAPGHPLAILKQFGQGAIRSIPKNTLPPARGIVMMRRMLRAQIKVVARAETRLSCVRSGTSNCQGAIRELPFAHCPSESDLFQFRASDITAGARESATQGARKHHASLSIVGMRSADCSLFSGSAGADPLNTKWPGVPYPVTSPLSFQPLPNLDRTSIASTASLMLSSQLSYAGAARM